MLRVAVYRPADDRYEQALLATSGAVLLLGAEEWRLVEPPADGLRGPWVELHVVDAMVRWRASGGASPAVRRLEGGGARIVAPTDRLALPLRVRIGDLVVELSNVAPLVAAPMTALERRAEAREAKPSATDARAPAPATLTRWFEAVATLNRWSVGREEFWRNVVSLVVDPIGFDAAYAVRRGSDGRWAILAAKLPHPELGVWLDLDRLDPVLKAPTPQFDGAAQPDGSAWAVAPWRDEAGGLAGVVVGVRRRHPENARAAVRHLEVNLVRLVSDAITSTAVREAQASANARRRGLLELAFSRPVADRIEDDPTLLDGARREVSLVFADLRDFSRRFHRTSEGGLGATVAYELLSDVMDSLTRVVIDHDGHLIDYYGDGLAAMWNAPVDQPNHAARACHAALAFGAALTAVNDAWADRLDAALRLGVGVHTGVAQVGNVGSRWRIKYGARGETVNLVSRVEGATKSIGVAPIATSAVVRTLDRRCEFDFHTTRLCRARLAGIEQATDLFAIGSADRPVRLGCTPDAYAEALALFEAGRLEAAERRLAEPTVGSAAAFLLGRVHDARRQRRGRRAADRARPVEPAIISLVET